MDEDEIMEMIDQIFDDVDFEDWEKTLDAEQELLDEDVQ